MLPWKSNMCTLSECLSAALVIQHAQSMCRTILSTVSCRTVPYFPTLSQKRHDFRGERKWLNIKYVFIFSSQLLSETSRILRRIMRDIICVNRSSSEVPLFLPDFDEIWIFSTDLKKLNYQILKNLSRGSLVVACG